MMNDHPIENSSSLIKYNSAIYNSNETMVHKMRISK